MRRYRFDDPKEAFVRAEKCIQKALGTNATELYLGSFGLTKVPESLRQLTQLQLLDLSYNQLMALPESLQNLAALEQLYLHGNEPLGLPAEVLGPAGLDVAMGRAEPAKPADILDYYFRTRGGRCPRPLAADDKAVRLFYSYTRKDETLRNELETHLKILERRQLIAPWHDRKIMPGEEWEDKIDENLECADIILLLISADFVASDYCWGKEMKRAMERHDAGEATVVPIILRDVKWKRTPFAKLQILPKDAKPVMKWVDRDSAWKDVSDGIERVVEEIRKRRGQ